MPDRQKYYLALFIAEMLDINAMVWYTHKEVRKFLARDRKDDFMKNPLVEALYESRQARQSNPVGTFHKNGQWFAAEMERCDCCNAVRTPSRRFPYSEMTHCRTRKHIANLLAKQMFPILPIEHTTMRKALQDARQELFRLPGK